MHDLEVRHDSNPFSANAGGVTLLYIELRGASFLLATSVIVLKQYRKTV